MKTVRRLKKVSAWLRNCPNCLETVWTVQELAERFRNCPESLETDQTVQKLSRRFRNWVDSFITVRTVSNYNRSNSKSSKLLCRERVLCALFICRERGSRAFLSCHEKCLRALRPKKKCASSAAIRNVLGFWASGVGQWILFQHLDSVLAVSKIVQPTIVIVCQPVGSVLPLKKCVNTRMCVSQWIVC